MSYIYRLKREHNIINLQNDMNMKPKSLLAIAFCLFVVAASAHANIPFRFATRAEAQMLITDIDEYTRGWNQFDINVRLQTEQGRKSKLLAFAMEQTLNWSDKDKERVAKSIGTLDAEIKKQKLSLHFPKELVFVKTTMKEEGGAQGYTRKGWIAIGEKALSELDDAGLTLLIAHEIFHILTRNSLDFKKAAYSTIGFAVMDREILFPADIIEKRISNPDVNRYDSYISLTVNGKKENCTMMTYTDSPYDGKTLFDYMRVGLIPLNENLTPLQQDGKTVVYSIGQAADFYEQVGMNTDYVINPEEILAENFAFLLTGKKDLKTPETVGRLREALVQAGKK